MSTFWYRTTAGDRGKSVAVIFLLFAANSVVSAEDFHLKNGSNYRGTMLIMNSLAGSAIGKSQLDKLKEGRPEGYQIARIDNGWQRIYCSLFQLEQVPNAISIKHIEKTIKLPPRPKDHFVLNGPGIISFVGPFDDFGRRRVTITTPAKKHEVVQAISMITTDHVMVQSLNCEWTFGLSLNTIPIETIDNMLRKEIKLDDPLARFGLVQLYLQAEKYEKAYDELEAIGREFPDKKDSIGKLQGDLMNNFGIAILRRLNARKRAGQHLLAEAMAKELVKQPISGKVVQDVQQYIQSYEDARKSIEQSKILLAEWQAKLNDSEKETRLQPLRSEVNDQLDFETLPRLDSFLKAEVDKQYDAAQRLGLAYSGWILGAANAVPDLDQALRLWDARQTVLEYLRTDDPSVHTELMKKLKSSENIGPTALLNMAAQLPPALDAGDSEPGSVQRVDTRTSEPVSYSVMLPAEYSQHHDYPLLIVLRSSSNTTEEAVRGWGGGEGFPDHGNQRGYIVVAPEYVDRAATEYPYSPKAHKTVLDCLIDVRKRFSVDSDRVFLAGQGMGADAAFDIGLAHPDEFAGVLPIGGSALHYCIYSKENARYTAWYVVGKGYDSDGVRDGTSNNVLDYLLKSGVKVDFTLVEYFGRNGESVRDELPKFFDWMDLPTHVRRLPPKQFKMQSLRKADNRFFWVSGAGLPRDYVLPFPSGNAQKVTPMVFDVSIASGANTIRLSKSPTQNYTLRLTPDLVDFDKQLSVTIGSQTKKHHLTPDLAAGLEELRLRGDNKRLPLAVISP